MTEKDKNTIKKLKAIINNTPYAGEKNTALNVLKNYCLKHNISESELDDEGEKTFYYEFVDNMKKLDYTLSDLFSVIVHKHYERKGIKYEHSLRYGYDNNICVISFITTSTDFIEIVAEFEFYKRHYKKQYKEQLRLFSRKFARAFLSKNRLLLTMYNDDDVAPLDKDLLKFYQESEMLADDLDETHYYKQLK